MTTPKRNDVKKPAAGGFQKKIDKNPYLFLVGAVVSAATISAGVTRYFWQRAEEVQAARQALEVRRLETQLQSIDRQVGGAPFLDVRSLFISKRGSATVPASVAFLPDAGLYVVKDDYWTHEKMREIEVGLQFIAVQPPGMRESLRTLEAYKKSPSVHVWIGKAPSPARAGVFSLAPVVTVKRMPLSDLIADIDGKDAGQPPAAEGEAPPLDLQRYYRGDVAGSVFVDTWKKLERMKTRLGPAGGTLELVTAQKVGNVFYAQGLMSLPELKAGKVKTPPCYFRSETIIFTTAADAFVVQTMVPGTDPLPSGTPAARVTEWLRDLRIVID